MKLKNIFSFAALLALVSCSQDSPFSQEKETGVGRLLTRSLSIDVDTKTNDVRSSATPDVNDFDVKFERNGSVEAAYKYSAMPEVVTLPVGDYSVTASYGTNPEADWESPYYLGSASFSVSENKVTDNVNPIVCRLANVRVSILFDSELVKEMSDDSKVKVVVGDKGALYFNATTDKSGYFRYVEESTTLVAEFSGTVEDCKITNFIKSYSNVQPGNHYRITFRLANPAEPEPGTIDPGDEGNEITVDADIKLIDINDPSGEDIDWDAKEDDDLRPGNGDDDEPDDPEAPDPGVEGKSPVIEGAGGIKLNDGVTAYLDGDNVVISGDEVNVDPEVCVLNITSDSGITAFTAEIVSNKLTPDELSGMGLRSNLDLVNEQFNEDGSSVWEALNGLGGIPTNVKGKKNVTFDISKFMGLLGALGADTHAFVVRVTNATGTTEKTLLIQLTN